MLSETTDHAGAFAFASCQSGTGSTSQRAFHCSNKNNHHDGIPRSRHARDSIIAVRVGVCSSIHSQNH